MVIGRKTNKQPTSALGSIFLAIFWVTKHILAHLHSWIIKPFSSMFLGKKKTAIKKWAPKKVQSFSQKHLTIISNVLREDRVARFFAAHRIKKSFWRRLFGNPVLTCLETKRQKQHFLDILEAKIARFLQRKVFKFEVFCRWLWQPRSYLFLSDKMTKTTFFAPYDKSRNF